MIGKHVLGSRKAGFLNAMVGAVVLHAVSFACVQAVELTHGPMVGHTTSTAARVWVRADGPCELHVRAIPKVGSKTIFAEKVRLVESENFCGSVLLDGLSASTIYSYRVFLNTKERPSSVLQEFMTFPAEGHRGVVRVGFGHSLIGPGEQTIWRSIARKKPHLFILMGDNIYSNTSGPRKQRSMYLQFRADPHFRAFAATTPIYAIWDDHDYGVNNSDRTQPGKKRSLATFNEVWPNPPSQAGNTKGIWTRFTVGRAQFFRLDVRYHRCPNSEPDGPDKTMLGFEQRAWLLDGLAESSAVFKFLVSASSWNCGGVASWNHQFTHEYDAILSEIAKRRTSGIILLGGDHHFHKIGVRPRESWGGYDLHEWMAGQLWNKAETQRLHGTLRGFGLITIDTSYLPARTCLEFFDEHGQPRLGRRIPYTTTGALRAFWDSPPGAIGNAPRSVDGELRPKTSGPLWEALPTTTGETLTEKDLGWPDSR
jgi:alkaline phosphatase D